MLRGGWSGERDSIRSNKWKSEVYIVQQRSKKVSLRTLLALKVLNRTLTRLATIHSPNFYQVEIVFG